MAAPAAEDPLVLAARPMPKPSPHRSQWGPAIGDAGDADAGPVSKIAEVVLAAISSPRGLSPSRPCTPFPSRSLGRASFDPIGSSTPGLLNEGQASVASRHRPPINRQRVELRAGHAPGRQDDPGRARAR